MSYQMQHIHFLQTAITDVTRGKNTNEDITPEI